MGWGVKLYQIQTIKTNVTIQVLENTLQTTFHTQDNYTKTAK
jgi:hypothetical protein